MYTYIDRARLPARRSPDGSVTTKGQQRRCFVHGHSRRDSLHYGGEQRTVAHPGNRGVVFTFTRGICRTLTWKEEARSFG